MPDLFTQDQTQLPLYSVSDLSNALKKLIEGKFPLVKIKGEVSGAKRHSSGHMYFSLKDDTSVLDAVCWRSSISQVNFPLEDGLEVICTGRLTTYGGRSKYQIIVSRIEQAGLGALLKLLEERKKKLSAEGLFDPARKKLLPFLPQRIGLITSPTGAVLQDILHRLQDRFPCPVILWPVSVQGEKAPAEIVQALEGFNHLPKHLAHKKPDVIILARGGGSIEDLWSFNEEAVVRAVANSSIPVISAVGHETDTTLCDYAADRRAPTPTAAAEFAVPVRLDLWEGLKIKEQQLIRSVQKHLETLGLKLSSLGRGLKSPASLLENKMQLLDERAERLLRAMHTIFTQKHQKFSFTQQRFQTFSAESLLRPYSMRFEKAISLLESYSYKKTLSRGFVLVKKQGQLIPSLSVLDKNNQVTLHFQDGECTALITEK